MFGFRTRLRALLGTDTLPRIEALMANEILTLLQGLAAQTADLNATQQASIVNIHNGFQRMDANIRDLSQQLADALNNDGKVTPEMQAVAEQIQTALDDVKKGAQSADDDFEPAEDPTDGGNPDQPADGGDVPTGDTPPADTPVDGGDTPVETPVDDTPTGDVPAVDARKR